MRKTIMNTGTLDLRSYSPNALKKIKKIINIGTLLLPENPSAEFTEAFADIKQRTVGSVLHLSKDAFFLNSAGVTFIEGNLNPNAIYRITGLAIIRNVKTDKPVKLMVTGMAVYEKSITNLDFISVTGSAFSTDFNLNKIKFYCDSIEINRSFIENLEADTTVIAGDDIMLTSDVTEDLLKEKQIHFIAGDNVCCSREIYGYVAANSIAGDKIKV